MGAVSTGRSSPDLGVVYYDPVLARRAAHGHLFLTVVSAIFTAGFAFVARAADTWLARIVVVLGVVGIAVNLLAASSYSADKKETDCRRRARLRRHPPPVPGCDFVARNRAGARRRLAVATAGRRTDGEKVS
ncbi:MAG TPA: hypothetical protein VM784_02895 [Actinomycetota bacterium]|nr:hypothetical protein [Actinomycetota bacterium]